MSLKTPPSEQVTATEQPQPDVPSATDGSEEFVFPTTVGQQRFWSLEALQPGNPALNMPLAARLAGKLDRRALELAIHEIVRRHEVLRCRFESEGGTLVQVVSPTAQVEVRWIDCTHLSAPAVEGEIEALQQAEGMRTFSLTKGPFLRGAVATFNPTDHLLMLTMHHIVSDGWSNGILLREFAENYTRLVRGEQPPFEDLPLQYADYAVWQQEWLQGRESAAQRQYWMDYLGTEIPVLNLPTDRPRSRKTTNPGAILSRLLPTALSEDFRQACQREKATPFMGYLTAYVMLLHRYTGRSEFVIGSPAACRTQTDLEGIIGLFANPILFRPRVLEGLTFRQLLHQIRDTTLANFSNQEYPFELLGENLRAEDSRRGVTWLQVYFIFQKAFLQPQKMPGLELTPLRSVSPGAMFEWMLGLVERAEGVRLQLEYNTDLFEGATIELALVHLERIIGAATRSLDFPVASLALDVTPADHATVMTPFAPVETTLLDLLDAGFKRAPETFMLKCGARQLKPGDLRVAARESSDPIAGMNAVVAATMGRAIHGFRADLVVSAIGLADALGVTSQDRVLSTGSLDTSACWEELLIGWSRGAAVIRPDSLQSADLARAAGGATVVFLTSAQSSELLRHHSPALQTARVIVIGPEPLSAPARESLAGRRIIHRLQLAESGITVALCGVLSGTETRDSLLPPLRWISVGGWKVEIVDRMENVVPHGIPGQLRVQGNSVARPLVTGDWMRAWPDGALIWLGHADDLDRSSGYTLELHELGAVACRHPCVWSAHAVVAATGGSELILHVVPKLGESPTPQEIKGFLAEQLPVYMLPAVVVIHAQLPTDSSGRTDYAALRKADWLATCNALAKLDYNLEDGHQEKGGVAETKIAAIFAELLHLPEVDRERSFFHLGGHSLLAVKLFDRIEKEFQQRLPLATLLANPSVRALAGRIQMAGAHPTRWPCLVPVRTEGNGPKFFCVHGAGGNVLLYRELARRMSPAVRFYGLQAQGLDGESECLVRIEAMASRYLEEILAEQPQGPYFLGGYCMGGNIAYEIGRLLRQRDQSIGMIALLDSYNLRKSLYDGSTSARLRIWLQKAGFHLDTLAHLSMAERKAYLSEKLRLLRERIDDRWMSRFTSGRHRASDRSPAVNSVLRANHVALAAHHPQPLVGDLVLFRPRKNYYSFPDPKMGWGDLVVGQLESVVVTANPHAMLIEPFVQVLAAELSRRILRHDATHEPAARRQ